MANLNRLKRRTREDYRYILEYRTRWYGLLRPFAGLSLELTSEGRSDNDMYDHMNNSIYNFLYDSVINAYLMEHCGLHPPSSPQYGMVVHSHNDYFAPISFPACAELALRVNRIGSSSVTYEIALFEKGQDKVKSVGEFVQVFVDRATGRPNANGMGPELRRGLERILVPNHRSRI